eukprot:PhF_6_TR9261/c0_g1_i2/m.14695/K14209/SLC36A, PAT; solute carrier family 36 (proton-coupled amino acid transporter)
MSTSPVSVGVNLFKAIVSSTLLAMPYCVMRAGLIPALILFAVIWTVNLRTTIHVARCAVFLTSLMSPRKVKRGFDYSTEHLDSPRRLGLGKELYEDDSHDDNVVSYMQLCTQTFGEKLGKYVAWSSILPCQWSAGVSYLIFLGLNTSNAVQEHFSISPNVVIVIMTGVHCLMCAPKSASYLTYTAVFGNLAMALGLSLILYYAIFSHGVKFKENVKMWGTMDGTFEAFGILILCFSAQPETLGVLSAANQTAREYIARIIFAVQFLILSLFGTFSVIVYASFGGDTKAIAFDNLPPSDSIVKLVRMSMTVMVAASYPFVLFPVFHVFETTMIDADNVTSRLTTRWTIIITTGLIAMLCGNHFAPVTALCGAISCVVAFVLPPIFHLVIRQPTRGLSRLGDYVALVGGVIA